MRRRLCLLRIHSATQVSTIATPSIFSKPQTSSRKSLSVRECIVSARVRGPEQPMQSHPVTQPLCDNCARQYVCTELLSCERLPSKVGANTFSVYRTAFYPAVFDSVVDDRRTVTAINPKSVGCVSIEHRHAASFLSRFNCSTVLTRLPRDTRARV